MKRKKVGFELFIVIIDVFDLSLDFLDLLIDFLDLLINSIDFLELLIKHYRLFRLIGGCPKVS